VKNLYWIGARESDIYDTGVFFKGSVTFFGEGVNGNCSLSKQHNKRLNHNIVTKEQTEFVSIEQQRIMETDSNALFMSYNPKQVYLCPQSIIDRTCCLNSLELLTFTSEKIRFRNWAKKIVPTFHSEVCKGQDITYSQLAQKYPEAKKFVIQSNIASGGYGTIVMDADNAATIQSTIVSDDIYLVSPYMDNNISINIHAIIYDNEVVLTPASIQIMVLFENKLLYRGADFISYKDIESSIREKFVQDTISLCKELQKIGYRGVCGIDAMIVNDVAFFMEINNRFQGSTPLINRALHENNYPSIQELNFDAFHHKKASVDISQLEVCYSNYVYINYEDELHSAHIYKRLHTCNHVVEVIRDGYSDHDYKEKEAYLYKVIFNTNITSIAPNQYVRLHQNIVEPDQPWNDKINRGDRIALKIALMNQGIILSEEARQAIAQKGGIQDGVNSAVDITIDNIIVNCPRGIKFTELSPFQVRYDDEANALQLFYYDVYVENVLIPIRDSLRNKETKKHHIAYDKICLLATDRLRIQHSSFCVFKENHIECKFCEVSSPIKSFDIEDVVEVVDAYFDATYLPFRHILVGGLSGNNGEEKDELLSIISYVRTKTTMPIYLMCLPPTNMKDIEDYYEAGVTEVSYNIELYDRKLAAQIMPGKGKIPIDNYLTALKESVRYWGNTGDVRTAFVVGLESFDSLLNGITTVCALGVAPILSIFRPIPGTYLHHIIPPSNQELYDLYIAAEHICHNYNLRLGPSCVYCQNNTLSFPVHNSTIGEETYGKYNKQLSTS
jgi:hypothetical protein